MSLVLYDMPGLFDYESYLPSYGDCGEPLISSQEETYDDTYYLTYDYKEVDYYSNRFWHASESSDEGRNGFKDGGNWFGDYEYLFGGYLDEKEAYSGIGYQDYGMRITLQAEIEENLPPYPGEGFYGSYFTDIQQKDYKPDEDQSLNHFSHCSEGSDFREENREFPYHSSWVDWNETMLYGKIFGCDTYNMDAEH